MITVEYARTFPLALEATYDRVLEVPLERILGHRHLAIPGVRGVDQTGEWGQHRGQQRTIRLADGGTMVETLTTLERPQSFGYTLSTITGPMKLVIAGVEGVWAFTPDGAGTRVTWSWQIRPTTIGRVAMRPFARMWSGMAARAFDEIGGVLSP